MSSGRSVRRVVTGPLAPFEMAFRAELARVGYTSRSTGDLVRSLAGLSGWLERRALLPSGLTPEVVADLRGELPKVGPVLGFLRQIGEVAETEGVVGAAPVEAPAGEAPAVAAPTTGAGSLRVKRL